MSKLQSQERNPEMLIALHDLVTREAISIVYQPIVDLRSGHVTGYEALTRPDKTTAFENAGDLFAAAEELDMVHVVEGLARRAAFQNLSVTDSEALLFVNNSPPVFTAEGFVEKICGEIEDARGVPRHRVVLEITERTDHGCMDDLAVRSLVLREQGFRVALDDVGAGISGLNQIMALRPNWIKIDLELVRDIDLDPLKQNLIRFFVNFAHLGNMGLIAEGIEREAELRTLVELGVSHGQGFYLARPGEFGTPIDENVAQTVTNLHEQTERRRLRDTGQISIESLAVPVVTCDQSEPIGEVCVRLQMQIHQAGLVVLDGRRYIGWISREWFTERDSLFSETGPVCTLPLSEAPIVEWDVSLAAALEVAAAQPTERQTLPLIVQKDGAVTGMVTLRQLLMTAAETHRRAPSHIAPLTGLPSRVQADRWLAQQLRIGHPADIAFVDLRGFDAYNLAHGFDRGDEMLCRLVGLIKSQLIETDHGAVFFSHLGGDRFMLAFNDDATERLLELQDAFNELRSEFFSAMDIAAQVFKYQEPNGEECTYPITTLRVVYLPKILQRVSEPRDVHFIASRLSLRQVQRHECPPRGLIVDERRAERAARQSA